MSRDQLNEAFGAPAEPAAVDPSHVLAIAQRIKNLADEDKELKDSFNELKAMLEKRLPSEAEIATLRVILSDRAGREWLQKRLKVYGIGGLSLLATIYVTRAYLSQFLNALARVLGG
jgi:hypothetical protein